MSTQENPIVAKNRKLAAMRAAAPPQESTNKDIPTLNELVRRYTRPESIQSRQSQVNAEISYKRWLYTAFALGFLAVAEWAGIGWVVFSHR